MGDDNQLYHDWEASPDHWVGAAQFTGQAKQIAAAQDATGSLQVFYVGTDDKIYNSRFDQSRGWVQTALGGWAKQIAVAQNADGRLEIFYIGTNDSLYHNWQVAGGGWNGETAFPNESAVQITATRNQDGRLEIFYVGTNEHGIYHNWQQTPGGGWNGVQRFNRDYAQQIAVAQNADGRLEIFYVGTNNKIYHNWQNKPSSSGNWNGESRLSNFPNNLFDEAKQIVAGRDSDGTLIVYYIGTNQQLYYNYQKSPGGSWAGEQSWTGNSQYPVEAEQLALAQASDGNAQLFYISYTPPSSAPKIKVPNVVGMTLTAADSVLKTYGLNYNLYNPGLSVTGSAIVTGESPSAGSSVDKGTTIWLTVEVHGIKSMAVSNQSSHNPLDIYLWSSSSNSWNKQGSLSTGGSMSISLQSNATYTLEALDPGQAPPNDRPYWEQDSIPGDANGTAVQLTIV